METSGDSSPEPQNLGSNPLNSSPLGGPEQLSPRETPKENTLDDVMEDIGGFGRFQLALILCVASSSVVIGWGMLLLTYSSIEPHWYCSDGNHSRFNSSPHKGKWLRGTVQPFVPQGIERHTSNKSRDTKDEVTMSSLRTSNPDGRDSVRKENDNDLDNKPPVLLESLYRPSNDSQKGSQFNKDSWRNNTRMPSNQSRNRLGSTQRRSRHDISWRSHTPSSHYVTMKKFTKSHHSHRADTYSYIPVKESTNSSECDIFGEDAYEECHLHGHSCHSFCFEGSEKTAVTEWDLVCDKEWIMQLIQSVLVAGVLVGSLIFGQLSDRYGRKNTLYGALSAHMVVNIVAGFSVTWEMYAVCMFFMGVCISGQITVSMLFVVEFLTPKWRAVSPVLPYFNIGSALLALVSYLLKDWSYVHFTLAAFTALFLPWWFYFPESVRWLAAQQRREEAKNVLQKVARTNRASLPSYTDSVLSAIARDCERVNESSKKYTYKDLFTSRKMAVKSLKIGLIWTSINIVFYGVSFGASSLGGNDYLNIFLIGVIDIPTNIISFFLLNKYGRKRVTISFLALTLLASLSLIAVELLASGTLRSTLTTALVLFAKMTAAPAFSSLTIWTLELYPTVVRNLGFGLASMLGRVGGMMAPFTIDLDDRPIPSYLVLSTAMLGSVLLAWGLAETEGTSLTDQLTVHTGSESRGAGEETSLLGSSKVDSDYSSEHT